MTFKDVFYNYFTPELLGDFVQATEKEREGCSILRGDVFLTRTSETMHELGMSCVALRDYKDATFNGFCKRLRPKPDSDLLPEYVGYYLRSPRFRQAVSALSTMSTRASLNNEMIGRLEISFPSRTAQARISKILKSLDDRITLLRETNTTLEAIAQALFKSWFVDFDPVRAKTEGRQPEGVDATTAALFPDSFEESELGLVPKGWHWAALADAYEMNPSRKLKKGEVAPYLDMSSAPTSGHCAEAYIQRETGSGAKFTNGDTLLARITPCLENGKSAFVDFLVNGQNGWGSTEFLVLRPKAPLPEYHGYLLARHTAFREFAIQSMSGTSGRQRIQNDVLGRFFLAIPTASVTDAFAELVTPIQITITANHKQAQTLTQLRDTLLPRLISGQLRLPEAEAMVLGAKA